MRILPNILPDSVLLVILEKITTTLPHRITYRKMNQISATIITFNEEVNLERCLNSLVGLADEIVVVDSFSEDATIEICRRYGCRITRRKFSGYGSQRQYACTLASHRYILSLDADEVISDEMRSAILRLKEEGFRHRMYSAQVINHICGRAMRHSGWKPETQVRLFDKRYATWDLRDVAERLTYSDSVVPARLPGCVHHYRCSSIKELHYKEKRNSIIRGHVLAAQCTSIGPLTPYMKAAGAFLRCHIADAALLDGKMGYTVALHTFRSELRSQLLARKLTRENSSSC